ncbi:FtsX-like permease family protein [Actinomarinicola tropica]|uniref:FtsX-like permease family protein n=1 Tax=Actinomarinicola tropica TaxID=2789776 RepID=A0A5Q2RPX3_9ACTN|nr:FtsX-like permease family protein [Actinomarinicola tropica]
MALRELVRRPGRFSVAGGALTLIVVLLVLLGGLLDGLFLGSTGLYRQQESDLTVYSTSARSSIIRSRIDADVRATIEEVEGVTSTYGLGVALVGARVPGADEIADTSVVGYEGAISGAPEPPAPGEAHADRRLEAAGVEVGQTLEMGPERIPVEVVGWVEDTSYLLQGGLLVEPGTWREVLGSSRPDATLPDETFQVLFVEVAAGADAREVATAIDEATGDATSTLTVDEAISALPGVDAQSTTFNQIIYVTFFVAGLVVALFFALVTLERTAQYGVLKAVGASSWQIFAGLLVQAVVVTAGAFVLGLAISLGISRLAPPDIPLQLEPSRAVFVAVGMLLTAVVGGSISLRRVIRIDPASAIG